MIASGMRVVDVVGRHERVQQRLDRRPRLVGRGRRSAGGTRPSSASSIASRSAQRQDLVEPEPGEARCRDRRQVGTRALHPEHADLSARVVGDRLLRGRVPAADVGERAVGAEQVRAVDEAVEHAVARCGALVPAVLRRRDAVQHGRRLAHGATSSGVDGTSSAKRCLRLVPLGRRRRLVDGRGERGADDRRGPPRARRAPRAPSPGRAGFRPASPPPARPGPAGRSPARSSGRAARSARRRRRRAARPGRRP